MIILIFAFSLTSCASNQHVDKKEIGNTVEQMMEYIVNENKSDLLNYFCSDIQENREEETLEEMEKAFEFINGNIVSYDYAGTGGGQETIHEGKTVFYDCRPEFRNVTTDTGYKYTVRFDYQHIWDERPECEGITKITIINSDNRDSVITIGRNYYQN